MTSASPLGSAAILQHPLSKRLKDTGAAAYDAGGTQVGERLTTRLFTRTTLIRGIVVGAVGTGVLVLGPEPDSGYAAIVPGLVLSGVGQGVVWTGIWIAAASGVHHDEQDVAYGMASTTLSVANAI